MDVALALGLRFRAPRALLLGQRLAHLEVVVRLISGGLFAVERELHREDKALAETAALLALSKKAEAIWGPKDEDE